MAKKSAPRTIDTPRTTDVDFARDGARAFWKRVLPKTTINYTDKSGKARTIDFDDDYLDDVAAAHAGGALDQTPFVLADEDNRHTMDPERFRGEVTAFAREDELPEDIAAAVAAENGGLVPPGLYSRIAFASKKAARAVLDNPKLGVSMRIREGFERDADGKKFARAPIHVLGTLDPKIPQLGSWVPALDLSNYAPGDVIDLSGTTYGDDMGSKRKDETTDLATATVVPDIDDVDPDDIADWTDEQLASFIAQYASDDAEGDTDDDTDDAEGDTDEQESDMSNTAAADIEFANEQASTARREAREALNRAAEMRWAADRAGLLRDGVPPAALDLAEPVLRRPNDTVVDLSNFDEDDLNVTEVVRGLIDMQKGTIDFSTAQGHGSDNAKDDDVEADVRKRFDTIEI